MPRKKKQPDPEPTLADLLDEYHTALRKLSYALHDVTGVSFCTTIQADYPKQEYIGFHPHRDKPALFQVDIDTTITFN